MLWSEFGERRRPFFPGLKTRAQGALPVYRTPFFALQYCKKRGSVRLDARQVPWFPILVFGALIFNMIPPPLSPSSDSNRHQILSQSPVASASESDQILNQVAVDSGPESDQILNRDPTGI